MTAMYINLDTAERLEAENARLKEQVRRLREALVSFLDEYGHEHIDPGCPEDDTCTCDNLAGLNALLKETAELGRTSQASEGEDIDGADLAGCNPLDHEDPWEID